MAASAVSVPVNRIVETDDVDPVHNVVIPVLTQIFDEDTDVEAKLPVKGDLDLTTIISEELRRDLGLNFTKCVNGYHLINDDPIKESPWEDINATILNASKCIVKSKSNGSHKSGKDIDCLIGCLSNKSAAYKNDNTSFELSSYRLTSVCSDKDPGKIDDIIKEINNRKNFAYYSIIVREENEKQFLYDWYLIPSDFPELNPASYKWHPKIGKTKRNKGSITGWETDILNGSSMSITFSMSSQLWIDVKITEDMKKFVVGSCRINRGRKYTYITLFEKECLCV